MLSKLTKTIGLSWPAFIQQHMEEQYSWQEHSTGAAISTSVRGQKIGIGQSEHAEHKIWMENLRAGQIHRSMCAICLDDFSVGQHVLEIASCGHLFHKDCLIQWEGDCPYRCPRPGASNV
eukprot:TRINITY_DN8935_c0_g1_i2.p1 TRINITY_DN8935_c0_g1~~TRINITY_DN8935_c0_g1_i2.p1  ORF type:complete len:120 (-),score=14.91 TRINITY_DN8935_c0_g1_i2:247-606(-)